jgi:hypothetical protein
LQEESHISQVFVETLPNEPEGHEAMHELFDKKVAVLQEVHFVDISIQVMQFESQV